MSAAPTERARVEKVLRRTVIDREVGDWWIMRAPVGPEPAAGHQVLFCDTRAMVADYCRPRLRAGEE
jgi:hypothetical protein